MISRNVISGGAGTGEGPTGVGLDGDLASHFIGKRKQDAEDRGFLGLGKGSRTEAPPRDRNQDNARLWRGYR
jgi:hypothetical protein